MGETLQWGYWGIFARNDLRTDLCFFRRFVGDGGARLDTVEEVSEPASSEYWQLESLDNAKAHGGGGGGGSLSSLPLDSLPPDDAGAAVPVAPETLVSSITTREELFSVTEIEVPLTTTVIQTR